MDYTILYRGKLSNCNYSCWYCPFDKEISTPDMVKQDQVEVERFVDFVRDQAREGDRISLQFTPREEALRYPWYQEAAVRLSQMGHVKKVVFQTNLSSQLDWIEACHPDRFALWTSYHPLQVELEQFLGQCRCLDRAGIAYSVGAVGLKEQKEEILRLRRVLPQEIYLWVNSYKSVPNYYDKEDISFFQSIDPLFPFELKPHASKGKYCRAGHTVAAVAGDGTLQRCHFIKEPIGNIYRGNIKKYLKSQPCTREWCECHIGYVHLDHLGLYKIFGENLLARVPVQL